MSEPTARIFAVRGYMKSGTNWLCNLLNLHPQISCVGEFHWERINQAFGELLQRMDYLPRSTELRNCCRTQFQELVTTAIQAANQPGALWCGDRTPGVIDWHNLPDARFFDIVRDGRDILVSRAFHLLRRPETTPLFDDDEVLQRNLQNFQRNPEYFNQEAPHELLASEQLVRLTARAWVRIVTTNQQAFRDHPDRVFCVRYEALHAETEATRRRMYEFLDVDPNLAQPLDPKTQPGFRKERPQGLLRKGAVGDWQLFFTEDVEAWFLDEAAPLMHELGYIQQD